MLPVPQRNSSPTLEDVRELFARWRSHKTRRDPIPPALWNAAVSLTTDHSLHTVARALHLDYNVLKTRAREVTFVELTPVVPAGCTIEIKKPSGAQMRITGTMNVTELVRIFVG